MAKVIVVGGGLSGLSAAHTVLEKGGNVVLLDKNSFLGGNSTKATSGIAGALTQTQMKLGIPDSAVTFYEDTAHSARDRIRPELVRVLTYESGPAIDWLQTRFNLDLSKVARLGGHSFPRVHRGPERFPGMTITYALMEKLEEISKAEPHRAQVITKAKVVGLITEPGNPNSVIGAKYEKDGQVFEEHGSVIIATGGFGADFGDDSLLKKYRPEFLHLPTTNGDHCTGDGIKISEAIGANSVDMEMVQVHPTGLVDLSEPDSKIKFLAAEALRGVGGILLNADGQRFCDELGHRDYVTGEMWKSKGPFRLLLNSGASKEIEWHCKHYIGRGLMKKYANGAALAADMGISVDTLRATFEKYNEIAKDPKKDPYGKKYFHNVPIDINDEFCVSIVTPVVHYCMGGLEVNEYAQVKSKKGVIEGLYASGEVVGGVHGSNRLGGNSLLDCVVFGRVAGATAATKLLLSLSQQKPAASSASNRINAIANHVLPTGNAITATISQNGVQTRVEVDPKQNKLSFEVAWGSNATPNISMPVVTTAPASTTAITAPVVQATAPPQTTAAPQTTRDSKREYTLEEVAKHNKESDCWVIVNGQVLDVTHFLKDHPGGKKAILLFAGRDATSEFNLLHKPDVVEKYAPDSIIGVIKAGSNATAPPAPAPAKEVKPVVSLKASTPTDEKIVKPIYSIKPKPSNIESRESGGTADALPEERKKATFDVEKMTNVLDGGPDATKRRRFIFSVHAGTDMSAKYNWDRHEATGESLKHFIKVHEDYWDTFKPTRDDYGFMSDATMFAGSLINHYGLFIPTLDVQATEDQRKWWVNRARRMQIIGCYAQTELGHGSNVRGLMTTATYDKKTQEFVLNTPTLKSIKWWPGALGRVATHALVYAQLIIDGKEYGVHTFMLQIRDENHLPLPGIELGDLGNKLGDAGNDTGFMIMTNVRIPREFMLARFQHVTPEGIYEISPERKQNAKLHYATMMFTRGAMVRSAGGYLSRAVIVAARYSCVRRQGFINSKSGTFKAEERQIIDYQVQRYRIFKQLALAYAIRFSGGWMMNKFSDLESSTGDSRLSNVDALPEIAATSAGLKALCTYLAWAGIEDCRKACGGNGYLLSSGVAALSADYVFNITAEGDFIVMMLQTARFLLKSLNDAINGDKVAGPVSYLTALSESGAAKFDLDSHRPAPVSSPEEFFNLNYLLQLFQFTALSTLWHVGQSFQQKLSTLGKFEDAWNASSLELCNAVRIHCLTFMLSNFIQKVNENDPSYKFHDPAVRNALSRVCALYALSQIIDDPQWIGILSFDQINIAKSAVAQLLDELRPDAVALTDAFDIPDRVLNSTVGRHDGNVYEALYEAATKSPLNQRDPFLGYHEYLRPHLDLEFLKKRNAKL